MFQNQGHFLSFKASVEGIEVPAGWPNITSSDLVLRGKPRIFSASIEIPFEFGTEALNDYLDIIEKYAKAGSIINYNQYLQRDGITDEGYIVSAQYSIHRMNNGSKVIFFAESKDHEVLEDTIKIIMGKFKTMDMDPAPLPKLIPEWDISKLKAPAKNNY